MESCMPVAARVGRKRPGPRPSTSREDIVQCAIRMLDREGPDTLTFRAVARELGITVGALARYFESLVDLQDEVAAKIMSDLRPLDATSKVSMREQLLRLGMEWLDINRAHPYLLTIHGAASATMVARHTGRCVKALLDTGLDLERALAIYSIVGNLAYAWGVQGARRADPELQSRIVHAFTDEMGEFAPQMAKLTAAASTVFFRRSFLLAIDGCLAEKVVHRNKR
jgi:AcrR family transcriptional regulator